MANRIFSRIGIAPGHGLYINVLVLGYMFYNNIFRFFELVPHSRKLLAFEGTPLEEMAQGLKFGVQDGAIIVKENHRPGTRVPELPREFWNRQLWFQSSNGRRIFLVASALRN